jgi:thymidylate synthase ThyX
LSNKHAKDNSLLLAEVREYLAKGDSLYRSLINKGVSPEIAQYIVPLANVGHENDPVTEIAPLSEALLEANNE